MAATGTTRRGFLAGIAVAGTLVLSAPAGAFGLDDIAVPAAKAWAVWDQHDAASQIRLHHDEWDKLLANYVEIGISGVNRVDYERFRIEGRAPLADYTGQLAQVPVARLDRTEQLAYWINLYNALVVEVLLDHWPVRSVREIDQSIGTYAHGLWGRPRTRVAGISLSLDDIEHRILRPIWKDPRVLYALCKATVGGPHLQPVAFDRANLETQLEGAASDFVNGGQGLRRKGWEVLASKFYEWYRGDFGGSEARVLGHLRQYAAPPLDAAVARATAISGYFFDWSLNAVQS